MLKSMFTGPCYIDLRERMNQSWVIGRMRGAAWVLGSLAMLERARWARQPGGSMSDETAVVARMARWAQGCREDPGQPETAAGQLAQGSTELL